MTFLWGTIRVAASAFAVYLGAAGWPIWWLVGPVVVHAGASYLFSASLYSEVRTRLARDDASDADKSYHDTFYRPVAMREVAYSFVKCGLGYFAGFWLAQFFATPTGGPGVVTGPAGPTTPTPSQ
ncbi:MAG: hypothetical protein AAGG99_02490 [Pseudomonadota bacterium]